MHFFQFSKTVLSLTNSKKCVSVTSLVYTDEENKENIEPRSTPPRLDTPPRLSPITMTPLRGRSLNNHSRRIVSTPARMPLTEAQQANNGEVVEAVSGVEDDSELASPPSVLKKAMRRISKGALEMAYAAIQSGDPRGGAIQPTPADAPMVAVYEPVVVSDNEEEEEEKEDDENMSPVSISSMKMPQLLRTKMSPAKLSSPEPQMQPPMLPLDEPSTPTPRRSLTLPRVRPQMTGTAPDALMTALASVSDSSVRSAYAAFRRGDSFRTSLSVDAISTLQPQQPQQAQHQVPGQIHGKSMKVVSRKPVPHSKSNNSSRNTVATIAARRAFVHKPFPSKRRNQTTANITSLSRANSDATGKLRKPNPTVSIPKAMSANHITFLADEEPRGRTRERKDNASAHAWWTSAQSSYASTPNASAPPSILDFSPERPKGARGKIRRLLKKLVGKLKGKGYRRKLEKKHGRKGEEAHRGFLGRYTVSRTVSRELGNA